MILIEKIDGVIGGKPKIVGTRISVELILEMVSAGCDIDEIIDSYPHLDREVVDGIIETGLIARKCLENVDPESKALEVLGRKLHMDSLASF